MKYYFMFDVGGTQIKAGIMNQEGELYKDHIFSFPSKAKESKEVIFSNLKEIIIQLENCLKDVEDTIAGIGMAFPGPFDYENGISKIQGLDKYEAIYNLSIKDELCRIYPKLKRCKFIFLHDVESFALGVCNELSPDDEKKIIHLCIGTGSGSTFTKGRRVLKKAEYGVPENGWIYPFTFKEGRIDDYLSVRGLKKLAIKHCNKELEGAELYALAKNNDEGAKAVFHEFGQNIEDAMKEFFIKFKPDILVFGGQISKSFIYFGKKLESYCNSINIKIHLEIDTSKKIMEGLYTMF